MAALDDSVAGAPGADSVDALVSRANRYELIREGAQPERAEANLRNFLQARVDQCLVGRGYVKFRLTAEQRHRLGKLPIGSEQRRAYLFSLASDPGC